MRLKQARILAAALQAYGIDAEALPRVAGCGHEPRAAGDIRRRCLPALMTTEDMLWRIHQPDFDATREAFFQGKFRGSVQVSG